MAVDHSSTAYNCNSAVDSIAVGNSYHTYSAVAEPIGVHGSGRNQVYEQEYTLCRTDLSIPEQPGEPAGPHTQYSLEDQRFAVPDTVDTAYIAGIPEPTQPNTNTRTRPHTTSS